MKTKFLAISLARIAGAVAQAFMGVLLARSVSPAEYGLVTALIGVFLVWFVVVDVGMSSFAGRSFAVGAFDEVATLLWFSGRAAIVGGTLAILVILLAEYGQQTHLLTGLMLLVAAQALEKYTETRLTVAIAADRTLAVAVSIVVRRVLSCGVFVILLVAGGGEYWATSMYATGMVVGSAVGAGHIRWVLGQINVQARRLMPIWDLLRKSVPFAVNDLSIQSRALDVFLVAGLTSPAGAGLYSAATKLTSPFQLLSSTLASVVLPASARAESAARRRLWWTVLGLAVGLSLLAAPVGWFGTELSVFLLGEPYADAGGLVAVFVVSFPVVALSTPLAALLQGVGRERFVGLQGLVTSVLLLGAVAGGAMLGDEMGAAIGFAIVAVCKFVSLAAVAYSSTSSSDRSQVRRSS